MAQELILIRITGEDRPGLTAGIMGILAQYDADIMDIGQADIHKTLSLGLLIRVDEQNSGPLMKNVLFTLLKNLLKSYSVRLTSMNAR